LQYRALRRSPLVDVAGGGGAVTSGLVDPPPIPDGQVKRDRNGGLVGEQNGALARHQFVAVIIDLTEFHREGSLPKKYKKSRPFSWPHEIGAMARAFNALLWHGAILSIIFEFIAKIEL